MNLATMHGNCVACLGRDLGVSAEEQTLVLLHILHNGGTPEGIVRDLCFVHRSKLQAGLAEVNRNQ